MIMPDLRKSSLSSFKLLLPIVLGVCLLSVLVYWGSQQVNQGPDHKSVEEFFNRVFQEIAAISNDQLMFEENPSGHVDAGDGQTIHEDCFVSEAEQVFGTNRLFDEVIVDYEAHLRALGYDERFANAPPVQFQGTPDERVLYWFYSTEVYIAIHELLESKEELSRYGLDQTQYETYYIVTLKFRYPSFSGCRLVGG